ncbi:hypothetical protein CU098_004065, partial [Rhizopus stolonifer]
LPLTVDPSLGNPSSKIFSLIQKDQEPFDLESCLKNSEYSNEYKYAFAKTTAIPYPKALSRSMQETKAAYKVGVLQAINRFWLSTNTGLYLWDYLNNHVFRYECNGTIQNVDLITFDDHHELLVSTTDYLYLHALAIDKDKLHIVSNASIKSSGVVMSNIVTISDTKRVFMKGSDGHLYELSISFDNQGNTSQHGLVCHTENPLMYYMPSFFKSVPTTKVKCIALDNDTLFVLQSDSSIHAVNIKGTLYSPVHRFEGSNLASIHVVPPTESSIVRIMAVSEKGDRHYLKYQYPEFTLYHTRSAPSLAGSLLFNGLMKEETEVSFYQQGVFGAVLSKSEKQFLIWSCPHLIESDQGKKLLEDLYTEALTNKVWGLIQRPPNSSRNHFKPTFAFPEDTPTEYLAVSDIGLIQYIQRRPVDYLQELLQSTNSAANVLNFSQRFGYIETDCLAYMLACSRTKLMPEAGLYLRQSIRREEGLLLYFARVVQDIWGMDISQKKIPQDQLAAVQDRLKALLETIYRVGIPIKNELLNLITRTIESISFVCFVHNLEWIQIKSSLTSLTTPFPFADMVSTEKGIQLADEIVLVSIQYSDLSNSSNNFSFIGNFLESECLSYFGYNNVVYYKGLECLQSARNHPNEKKQALLQALHHFQTIIEALDITVVEDLSRDMCLLENYLCAIHLIFAKYQTTDAAAHEQIYATLLPIIQKVVLHQKQQAHAVLMDTLKLTMDKEFHYKIYQWLFDQKHKQLMITLETPLLLDFIQTEITNLAERYACLKTYYTHREQHELAIDSLFTLATQVPQVVLSHRVRFLKTVCDEVSLLPVSDHTKQKAATIQHTYKVAQIQLDVHNILANQSSTEAQRDLASVADTLLSADKLLEIVYDHALYEPALCLLNLMERCDWEFVKRAWTGITESCSNEKELKSKVIELTNRLYPSIPSFPVYIILQILQQHFNADFASDTLIDAGVPSEVVSDAKQAVSSH